VTGKTEANKGCTCEQGDKLSSCMGCAPSHTFMDKLCVSPPLSPSEPGYPQGHAQPGLSG
jgi:hypothetical protein